MLHGKYLTKGKKSVGVVGMVQMNSKLKKYKTKKKKNRDVSEEAKAMILF